MWCWPSGAWDSDCRVEEGVWGSTNGRKARWEHDGAWDGYCQVREANTGGLRVIAFAERRCPKVCEWPEMVGEWPGMCSVSGSMVLSMRVCEWGRHAGTTCDLPCQQGRQQITIMWLQDAANWLPSGQIMIMRELGWPITHSFTTHSVL